MSDGISAIAGARQIQATAPARAAPRQDAAEIGFKLETMVWAEMLKHTGLEKAMTMNGGEGAAAFSRYVIEAIAADLAESHPLGITEQMQADPNDAELKQLAAQYGMVEE